MDPRITARQIARPEQWGKSASGMAWHHIIPFSLLRKVWNRLVDQHIATEIAEARRAIRQYLLLSDPKLHDIESLIERIRAVSIQKRAGHNQVLPLEVHEAHALATIATWPKWNVVEGPSTRSDDPKDRDFDRFTVGLTPEETGRMRAIEMLFVQVNTFVVAGPAPSANHLRDLARAASQTRPLVYCDIPIRFRPEMWTSEGNGTWHKRRSGES